MKNYSDNYCLMEGYEKNIRKKYKIIQSKRATGCYKGGDKINKTELIEVQLMADGLKGLKEPKEVLEKLTKTNLIMGWGKVENVRLLAYASWLIENDKIEWAEYLKSQSDFFVCLQMGVIKNLDEPPKGWIYPRDYCMGQIPEKSELKK